MVQYRGHLELARVKCVGVISTVSRLKTNTTQRTSDKLPHKLPIWHHHHHSIDRKHSMINTISPQSMNSEKDYVMTEYTPDYCIMAEEVGRRIERGNGEASWGRCSGLMGDGGRS